jgi:hypothetical protein
MALATLTLINCKIKTLVDSVHPAGTSVCKIKICKSDGTLTVV